MMITIEDKRKCSGCGACGNACPLKAISFEYDEEGFRYPHINSNLCIKCGKCDKVCPFNDKYHGVPKENRYSEVYFYAAQCKEKQLLSEVSSGGAFQAFAKVTLSTGGVVYGAAQENVDEIFHIRATNEEEVKRTRKSKYFQSDIGDCLKLVKKDLDSGLNVLFSGTGCQISGLNCFLGHRYKNLYTCEVICHGVPSQKVWKQYRKEKEKLENKRITGLVFRDKSAGWSKNQYKIIYEDGSEEYERSTVHPFHAGYLQGFFYRPSCGACAFASMPRVADITLADYWKYRGPMRAKDTGVSLVAVNNPHGKELLNMAEPFLNIEITTKENALDSCRHMDEYPVENPLRREFIETALKSSYFEAKNKYIRIEKNDFLHKVKRKIKAVFGR